MFTCQSDAARRLVREALASGWITQNMGKIAWRNLDRLLGQDWQLAERAREGSLRRDIDVKIVI